MKKIFIVINNNYYKKKHMPFKTLQRFTGRVQIGLGKTGSSVILLSYCRKA